jgi:hypothetical protein
LIVGVAALIVGIYITICLEACSHHDVLIGWFSQTIIIIFTIISKCYFHTYSDGNKALKKEERSEPLRSQSHGQKSNYLHSLTPQ